MPRHRERLTLDGGPVLDLAKLIPKGAGRAGNQISCTLPRTSGQPIRVRLWLEEDGGTLDIMSDGRHQSFRLATSTRHYGGQQWYVICPRTWRRVRVLYRPGGAREFASRHAWGRRAAYQSQFLDPVGRAWLTKARVKARLIGSEDPDEWDLPPKPKGMRWSTYQRWEAKYDQAEDALDHQCTLALARFMERR